MGNGELLTQPPWKSLIQELGVGGKKRCVRACDAGVEGPRGLVLGDFPGRLGEWSVAPRELVQRARS